MQGLGRTAAGDLTERGALTVRERQLKHVRADALLDAECELGAAGSVTGGPRREFGDDVVRPPDAYATAEALPFPQPGPTEPAPNTMATRFSKRFMGP